MEQRGKIGQMGVDEFEKRFDFFPSITHLNCPFGFVPGDISVLFEFWEVNMIQLCSSLVRLEQIDAGVIE